MKSIYILPALAIVSTVSIGTAFAAKSTENDALAIANAKVSLVQAITTAEQHAKGRAAQAEYEKTKNGWVYEVEVVSGNKVFEVQVDPQKGSVLASKEDKIDHDDDHDE